MVGQQLWQYAIKHTLNMATISVFNLRTIIVLQYDFYCSRA